MENLTVVWNNIDFRIVFLIGPTLFGIVSAVLLDRKDLKELIYMAIVSIFIACAYAMYTGENTDPLAGEIMFSVKFLSTIWFIITIFVLVLALISTSGKQKTKDS